MLKGEKNKEKKSFCFDIRNLNKPSIFENFKKDIEKNKKGTSIWVSQRSRTDVENDKYLIQETAKKRKKNWETKNNENN